MSSNEYTKAWDKCLVFISIYFGWGRNPPLFSTYHHQSVVLGNLLHYCLRYKLQHIAKILVIIMTVLSFLSESCSGYIAQSRERFYFADSATSYAQVPSGWSLEVQRVLADPSLNCHGRCSTASACAVDSEGVLGF